MTEARAVEKVRLPPRFLLWAGAAAVSDLGVAVMFVALGWAASAHGGTAAGLVIAIVTATRTVLLLLGGTVADRVGARAVTLVGDAALLVATATFALIAVTVGVPLWLLFLAALVEGAVSSFSLPASSSLSRRLVPDAAVGRASAVRGVGGELAELLGGPLGGVLVAAGGFGLAAGIDALSYLPVLLVMLAVRPRRPEAASERQSWRNDLVDGLQLVARDPLLKVALTLIAAVAGVFLPVEAVLVPLLVRSRGWSADANGLLLAGLSAGGILVALLISRTGTARAIAPVATGGLLLTSGGLALLATALPLPLLVLTGAITGAGIALFTGHVIPLVLQHSPETHLSRVLSVLSLVQAAALVLAAPLLGEIATTATPSVALAAGAAVLLLAGLTALVSKTWRRTREPPRS